MRRVNLFMYWWPDIITNRNWGSKTKTTSLCYLIFFRKEGKLRGFSGLMEYDYKNLNANHIIQLTLCRHMEMTMLKLLYLIVMLQGSAFSSPSPPNPPYVRFSTIRLHEWSSPATDWSWSRTSINISKQRSQVCKQKSWFKKMQSRTE